MSEQWILLRRYDDALEAELAQSFLRGHGVDVAVHGNTGASAIFNRFDTVMDIRLFVREEELAQAREVLLAMTCEPGDLVLEPPVSVDPASGSPYRTGRAHARELEPEGDPGPKQRYRRAAFALAFALPIGSGHLYARHTIAGAVLGIGIAGYFVTGIVRGDGAFTAAAVALVFFDALLAVLAVKRWNEGRMFSGRQQVGIAAVGLVAAMGAGLLVGSQLPAGHPGMKTGAVKSRLDVN